MKPVSSAIFVIITVVAACFPASAQEGRPDPSVQPADSDKAAKKPVSAEQYYGLYEAVTADSLKWMPSSPFTADFEKKPVSEMLLNPPALKKYVSEYFEPMVMIRPLYVTTLEDSWVDGNGRTRTSTELRRTYFGHREGFMLENIEIGFKGRVNNVGINYGILLEAVPREKDGTKSEGDYLKEVWVGWDKYSVFDVKAGRIKLPISQANLKSTAAMPFVYRPVLDSLLPKRLIGASASLYDPYRIVKVSGGVFNTAKEAHEQLFSTDSLMYAARAELNVDRIFDVAGLKTGRFFNLSVGGSFAYSKSNYDPRTEMRYLGLDAHMDLYIFTMEGELLFKDYFGEGTQSDKAYRGMGWHFDFVTHVWPTVLDLAFRIEESDNNESLAIEFADTAGMAMDQKKMWISFGLMLHLARQIDFAFNYVMRKEMEGREFKNDMMIGMFQFHL